ncbi:hypothetical protein GGR54DRAFT_634975 [Hypoxylon sp. NC1633]|nr:hypothetical protein GGR54DRAFT_634975 [Hypoxylon sp. NC1633]
MPTTRRSSANSRASGRQATLSFNHRVTKSATKPPVSSKPVTQSPLAKNIISAQEQSSGDEAVKKEEVDDDDDFQIQHLEPAPKSEPEPELEPEKSEAEVRALKISDKQVDQYWRDLERERVAKRVHQQDLTLAERVLRYWDVSSQYGPCVGISRMKRWQRADRLGLNPPLEVLAVLQRGEGRGVDGIEKAHIDEILNSTAVGAV